MGVYDRDYLRDQPSQQGMFGGGMTPVVKYLLAINVSVFLIQLFSVPTEVDSFGNQIPLPSVVQTWLHLDNASIAKGQVWRLLTYSICHSTSFFPHIVMNMLGLVIIGRPIERRLGSSEFLGFYLGASLLAGFAFLGESLLTSSTAPVVGASGGVFAILVIFGLYYPKQVVLLMFVFPVQVRWVVIGIIAFDLLSFLASLTGMSMGSDNIAHGAHLGGVLFALLYWKLGFKMAPTVNFLNPRKGQGKTHKKKNKKPKLSTDGRSKAEIDKQVDELLQKISDHGIHSLTDKERKFLDNASDKFG